MFPIPVGSHSPKTSATPPATQRGKLDGHKVDPKPGKGILATIATRVAKLFLKALEEENPSAREVVECYAFRSH